MNTELTEFIELNPQVMTGKPVIKGTRITVERIMEMVAAGDTVEDILEAYPHLTKEQILAALRFATNIFKNEEIYPL
jgi:uncharacterized protein (DUF433 family)